ncbi:hypothetical protein DWY99_03660 [[Clostridium] leptum]|uniref:Uncharacterized protein n=1 Tax=[Clostridium] leptum TaxID=1535 RepID=A0A412AZ78_9FIRM|nr:hypothetical protein DWY99_03660 [[Clostridium] leptum]
MAVSFRQSYAIIQMYPTDSDFWNNFPAQMATKTVPDFIALTSERYLPYINDGPVIPPTQYVEDGTHHLLG